MPPLDVALFFPGGYRLRFSAWTSLLLKPESQNSPRQNSLLHEHTNYKPGLGSNFLF